jgi:hypothetical protein
MTALLKSNVMLRNPDGTLRQRVSINEALRLEKEGKAKRISGRKASTIVYQMHQMANPSDSHNSPAQLTRADLEALVGLRKMNATRRERLIGWHLLKEKVSDFASGVRTMHLAEPDHQVA